MKTLRGADSLAYILLLSLAYSEVFTQECKEPDIDFCISLRDGSVVDGTGLTGIEPVYTNCDAEPVSLNDTESSVNFWLYTNGTEQTVRIYPACVGCLDLFQKGKPLVVVSHGYKSGIDGDFAKKHLLALTQEPEPKNVILVDWANLAHYNRERYDQAASNVKPVGIYTAKLLNYLIETSLTSADKIHFIGHSLGSHVANFVAKELKGKLARISALDPTRACFTTGSDDERIDKSDAEFVDVIHTSIVGFWEPRGHVDFYPNGGIEQSGCSEPTDCSHERAYELFEESILHPKNFGACRCGSLLEAFFGVCSCDNEVFMGWNAAPHIKGIFWLKTNSGPPYGQGKASPTASASYFLNFVVILATNFYLSVVST